MKKNLSVLHVYKTFFPETVGGVEVFLDTLCRQTHALGVDNTVFCLAQSPLSQPLTEKGYNVVQAKTHIQIASTPFSLSAFKVFSKLAARADVVHYNFPWPFMDMLHFACRIRKPSLVTYHSDIVKQKTLVKIYQPLMKKFLHSVGKIISTSPHYLASSETLRAFKDKTLVIPLGLDHAHYPVVDLTNLYSWKTKLPHPFFLFIGALRYYKGLHLLLEAVQDTGIPVVIAGTGDRETALKAQAAKLNLTHVHFVGHISDVDKVSLLQLCYGFVFPSHLRSEAFGLSLLEAAMFGKPLISTEIGTGTSLINKHKETGLVVSPYAQDLRDALLQLTNHPAMALEFGKNAKKRFETSFTAEAQAQAYLNVYKGTVK